MVEAMTDLNKTFVVYVVTNRVNGHRYVGCTTVGLEKRKKRHLIRSKCDKRRVRFHEALVQHGEESFDWCAVSSFDDENEALAEEVRLISELGAEYNIAAGGKGTKGVASWNRKPVTCLEDGNIFQSVTHASNFYNLDVTTVYDVCVMKYRSANDLHFIFGNEKLTEAERHDRIRKIEIECASRRKRTDVNKSHRGVREGRDANGRKATGPMKISKRVRCLDDGALYPSASEAGRQYNIARSAIIELCLGKNNRKSAGGFRFKYEDAP